MALQRTVDWIINLKHRCEKLEVKRKYIKTDFGLNIGKKFSSIANYFGGVYVKSEISYHWKTVRP